MFIYEEFHYYLKVPICIFSDCRGLACPAPVLKTKELLESTSSSSIRILVDNEAARQNVTRFLQSRGFQPEVETIEGGFSITGNRSGDRDSSGPAANVKTGANGGRIMVGNNAKVSFFRAPLYHTLSSLVEQN
jgi:TusA-related sulfurtransferase